MSQIDGLAEVLKNPLDRCLLLDAGDNPQLPAAAPADLNIASGEDRSGHVGPRWKLARPGGQTSNSLLETLAGWNNYLKARSPADSGSRHHEDVGRR
jgi:hypothetical protein